MNETKSSWSFVEISPEAREAAERAAVAAGMDLDAWLAQLIKYTSAMELKTLPAKDGGPGKDVPPPRAAPAPAPPARPLTTPPLPVLPPHPAAAPALGLSIAPIRPAASAATLLTGGLGSEPAAAQSGPERATFASAAPERRGAERASERPAAAPPFSLPNPSPRPTVTMPQRPGAAGLGLSLRPALAEQVAQGLAEQHAPGHAEPAPAPSGRPPRPAAQSNAERPPSPERPSATERPPDLAPPPAAPEAPRMIATDMLQPSRFAALASPKEDDIQAALDRWRASGMLEPLIARPKSDAYGQFEIISGIDRWHAARRAYVRQIPVLVRQASDQEALELGLVDQLRRGPISPLAEANIYLRLLNDAGLDTDRAARLAGKPAAHVATMVRILNLPKAVRAMLENGEITVMHARALLEAPNPEAIARDIVEKRLDIYQTEQLVRVAGRSAEMVDVSILVDEPSDESIEQMGTAPFAREPRLAEARLGEARAAAPSVNAPSMLRPPGEAPAEPKSPDARLGDAKPEESRPAPPTARRPSESRPREADVISTDLLERNIANALGVRCAISERNGVGVITLHYTSREELVRILARINGGGSAG
jgi:ParB family chromosome partitioning protein